MNIGWLSASPVATTGYGTETLEVCGRLLERHKVTCIGQTGDVIVWGGRQKVDTPYGKLEVVALSDPASAANVINQYYTPEYDLDIIIGFMDAFGIEFMNDIDIPVIGWIPIDGPFTEKWKHYVRDFHKVIAYSRFGHDELQKWLKPSRIGYIPHGISEEFHPLDKDEIRDEMAEKYGISKDAVLYVNVGANIGPRKELPLLMRTFSRWVKDKNAYLFLHTNAYQQFPRGFDLISWRRILGMEKKINFPKYNPIISPASNADLARIYTGADVYVQNSVAEGFGLPIVEAMACATPVITPLNSAQVELVEGRGWGVENVPDEMYAQVPVYVPHMSTYPVPNQVSLAEKFEESYNSPDLREKYGKLARRYVEENHSWKMCMDMWFRMLEKVEEELTLFKHLRTVFKEPPIR